jgi:hypothetical protein
MQFTIRDLIWATAFGALVIARVLDSRDRLLEKIDHRERCLVVERLAHKIDADVHDHLKEISTRTVALEGWSDSRDRREREDRDELNNVLRSYNDALSELRTDLERLKPSPPPVRSPAPAAPPASAAGPARPR